MYLLWVIRIFYLLASDWVDLLRVGRNTLSRWEWPCWLVMHLRRDSNDTASSSSNSFSLSMQAHLAGLVWPPVAVIGTLSTRGLLFLQISTVILKIVQGKNTKYSHQFLQGTAVPSDFHRNLENSSGQKNKIFPPVPPGDCPPGNCCSIRFPP